MFLVVATSVTVVRRSTKHEGPREAVEFYDPDTATGSPIEIPTSAVERLSPVEITGS